MGVAVESEIDSMLKFDCFRLLTYIQAVCFECGSPEQNIIRELFDQISVNTANVSG